ncbi:MAG: glycosyltransferase family 2 protein [Formivibrio sp.]|nr:glycosyltransferase family 2 protein [Formivibrio sp.]
MKLSICIPTYNRAAALRETLLCLLAQMEDGMEIVISDNASTDGTDTMVAVLQQECPCIRYRRWPQNLGADRNYLRSVDGAQGEYCWLFGSDDLIEPGTVRQVMAMLDDACDIYLFNRTEWHLDKGKKVPNYWLGRRTRTQVFDFGEAGGIHRYFGSATAVGALFSYLSSIVVRRAAWFSISYDESYTGTAYSHAYILLSMVAGGCRLRYDRRHLVIARLGDDSFAQNGLMRRILLDLDGYGKLRDDVFRYDATARRDIDQVLRLEYKWWRLASKRSFLNHEEWKIVRDALQRIGYSPGILACAGMLGNSRWVLRMLRWAKNCWLCCVSASSPQSPSGRPRQLS